ncbi:hypothetical protein [Streptomyces sp. NPDC097610]|uniref:hypothetical protein n=1 Tax=Streptomyces sp. NPDC097610 TaxID=3157227 RepID=UPI0033214509
MSIVNEPATVESCQRDYAQRTEAANAVTRAAVQNPGQITGNQGIPRQQGGASK